MAVTPPPSLTLPGLSPDRSDRTTFTAKSIARDDYIKNVQVPQLILALANVAGNATDAASNSSVAANAATTATTQASNAVNAAVTAATAQVTATTQAVNSSNSAYTANTSRTAIDNRTYPAPSATDPTTRPDGTANQQGDRYYNTTTKTYKAFDGTSWTDPETTAKALRDATEALALRARGYEPPVVYAAGIVITRTTQTVSNAGFAYAPDPASLPFTTSGTFETAKFRLIQGVTAGDLAASGGAALVGFVQPGTGAVVRSLQTKTSEVISVTDFGVIGDGSTNNNASLVLLRDWLLAQLASGNRRKVHWPAGRYVYTVFPNFAMTRLDIEFEGEVWLINNGVGAGFVLDGGATGPGVYGMKIKGFPLLYGGPTSAQGYYLRAVQQSHLELNARGCGSAFAGLHMEWCVSNTIHFVMGFNEGGLYNTPARGIFMSLRNANEECSYNTMMNVECSGMPVGVYQDGALGNVFIGGAIQACSNVGLQQTANAWNNKFIGTDFEVNTNGDIECNARESQFIGVDLQKQITFQAAAVNCSMIGGTTENIVIAAGATRTLLSGPIYNRFGAGTLTDNGTATRFRDLRDKSQGLTHNTPRSRNPITVGASPYTYTNTTGNEVDLLIVGGTISQLAYVRYAGDVVLPPSGMFRLSPGDAMSITYSAPPTVVMYTR